MHGNLSRRSSRGLLRDALLRATTERLLSQELGNLYASMPFAAHTPMQTGAGFPQAGGFGDFTQGGFNMPMNFDVSHSPYR